MIYKITFKERAIGTYTRNVLILAEEVDTSNPDTGVHCLSIGEYASLVESFDWKKDPFLHAIEINGDLIKVYVEALWLQRACEKATEIMILIGKGEY